MLGRKYILFFSVWCIKQAILGCSIILVFQSDKCTCRTEILHFLFLNSDSRKYFWVILFSESDNYARGKYTLLLSVSYGEWLGYIIIQGMIVTFLCLSLDRVYSC